MRAQAIFIAVEVDDAAAADRSLTATLAEVCPVDIFTLAPSGELQLAEGNIDECVLCRLCLDAAPAGAVTIIKRYDNDAQL